MEQAETYGTPERIALLTSLLSNPEGRRSVAASLGPAMDRRLNHRRRRRDLPLLGGVDFEPYVHDDATGQRWSVTAQSDPIEWQEPIPLSDEAGHPLIPKALRYLLWAAIGEIIASEVASNQCYRFPKRLQVEAVESLAGPFFHITQRYYLLHTSLIT